MKLRLHALYSNGTHDLLSRQEMSKFSTFSRKYSILMSTTSKYIEVNDEVKLVNYNQILGHVVDQNGTTKFDTKCEKLHTIPRNVFVSLCVEGTDAKIHLFIQFWNKIKHGGETWHGKCNNDFNYFICHGPTITVCVLYHRNQTL